jgi:hypothetical protein
VKKMVTSIINANATLHVLLHVNVTFKLLKILKEQTQTPCQAQ